MLFPGVRVGEAPKAVGVGEATRVVVGKLWPLRAGEGDGVAVIETLPAPLAAAAVPLMLPVREVDTVRDVVEDTELQMEAVRLGVLPNDPDAVTAKLELLEMEGVVDALRDGVTVKEVIEDTEPQVEAVKNLPAVALGSRVALKLPTALRDTRGGVEELPEAGSVAKSVAAGEEVVLTVVVWVLFSNPNIFKVPLGLGVIEFVVVVESVTDTVWDPVE